jgi:SPP1 gp7 family putative phage head morphogenesis protein
MQMNNVATATVDRAERRVDFKRAQQRFQKSRRAEVDYARKLRSIAQQVGVIVRGFAPDGHVHDRAALTDALNRYADAITPWARAVASRMLNDVKRRDAAMWGDLGDELGRNLKREMESAPLGVAMSQALEEQVALITSLPREAARRVHDITMLMLSDSTRASELAKEIMRSGEVTKSRATLIARTEVARTATELTKVRSQAAGVTHYVWRTSGDADVRESHKKMNGKVIAFDQPPEVEPGKHYHAGQFPNCRCYPEPIIPEE